MSKRVRILLGIILLTLMSADLGAHIAMMFVPPPGSSDGWSGRWGGRGEPKITSVNADGPATALQVGDELIAINGIKIKDDPSILNYGSRVPPGTRFIMTVRRAGTLRSIEIQTVPHQWRPQFNPLFLVIIPFLVTAWGLVLLRADDKLAWLLAVMLALFIGLMGQVPTNLPGWLRLLVGAAHGLGTLFLPVFVHFFLLFPERSPLLRRWPRLKTWIYAPYFLLLFILGPLRASPDFNLWSLRYPGLRPFVLASVALYGLYLTAGLVCLAINYAAANTDARRRLRVVMAGSAAGAFNLLVLILGELIGVPERLAGLFYWLDFATLFTLPLIPLAFVYAILRHKVIPVSLIIRRGVRYVLVSRGSILIEAVVAILAVTAVLTYIFSRFKPPGIVIGTVSAAVAIVIWKLEEWLHEKYLAPIIDRKFFRESYNSHQIIADLTNSLRSTTSLPQLTEMVATKIQSALKTENVTIFLRNRQSGDFLSGYSCEYNSGNGLAVVCDRHSRLPQYAAIIETLADVGQPIEVEDGIPAFAGNNGYTASDAERQILKEMKSALLMPLSANDGLIGMISLGPRLGDLPYSRDDKHLLMSVAGPTTFAIENARLVERMIEEARRREEIEAENQQRAKELEEARQLQISMLPKTIPQLPNLEIAAYMKTATEVGGDYYDFHLSDNGELTIVVGDATGHGLKAGTVVTATKSLFNHLAETPDVTELFHHSSRALKLMNMRSLFMAMTVARISGDILTLSSAGMPPVLIYRAETGEVEDVKLTGIPLGSVTSYRYRQQQLKLSSGDVIVLMSDGFPERFNPSGEMIGYEQANSTLAESASQSAQAIIEQYVRDADVWAEGYPQDDDVTFVVVKIR